MSCIGRAGVIVSWCCVVVFALSCSREPSPADATLYRDCDILLLVVDALRGDALGCTGADNDVSPNIDALAADGVVFETAIAQSTFTSCSIASLFTGLNPHHHGLYWGSLTEGDVSSAHILASHHFTLAERLAASGYRTGSWFQNRMLRGGLGFGQGFEVYEEIFGDKNEGTPRIFDLYLGWLADRVDDRPTFAYLHLLDLHDPYDPPPPFDTVFQSPGAVAPEYHRSDPNGWRNWVGQVNRGEREVSPAELSWIVARYDGTVLSIDRQVGRLLEAVKELGRYDDMLIVLTADHGDGFGEHGCLSHSNLPYHELVHVPLVLKLPGGLLGGSTVLHQVRLIDLLPTLVEMATGGEGPRSEGADGCSLLPLLTSGSVDPRPDFCGEAVSEMLLRGKHFSVAVRQGGVSYVLGENAAPALFDQNADPREQANLAGRGLPTEARLHDRALEILAAARSVDADRRAIDDRTIEQIRAMGYVE